MAPVNRFEAIEGEDLYRRLAMGERVVVVDVRSAPEFEQNHIPGSLLIPLQELDSRRGEIPSGGVPIAAVCEDGNRSSVACRLLAEYDFTQLFALDNGLASWPGPLTSGPETASEHRPGLSPSSFLVENFDLLKPGLALDIAAGDGRNAIYLATRGFDVDAVDISAEAIDRARAAARKLGVPLRANVADVEDETWPLSEATYDLILVFNYLWRPLFPGIMDGVVPGGLVIYQTFTEDQKRFGPPTNPEYLLRRGELQNLFADWQVLRYRESIGPARRGGADRAIAGIVARKPD